MTIGIQRRRSAHYKRLTVPLLNTSRRTPLHLSADADLALLYAGAWLFRVGGTRVPASGIIRRALVAYCVGLDEADASAEFAAAKRACAASVVAEGQQQTAELRLLMVPADDPLPSFHVIRMGPAAITAMAEFEARVEATLSIELARLIPRRKVKA